MLVEATYGIMKQGHYLSKFSYYFVLCNLFVNALLLSLIIIIFMKNKCTNRILHILQVVFKQAELYNTKSNTSHFSKPLIPPFHQQEQGASSELVLLPVLSWFDWRAL